jgi:hypothetical protein
MVDFENAFRGSFFHHNLKMHGPSCNRGGGIAESSKTGLVHRA